LEHGKLYFSVKNGHFRGILAQKSGKIRDFLGFSGILGAKIGENRPKIEKIGENSSVKIGRG